MLDFLRLSWRLYYFITNNFGLPWKEECYRNKSNNSNLHSWAQSCLLYLLLFNGQILGVVLSLPQGHSDSVITSTLQLLTQQNSLLWVSLSDVGSVESPQTLAFFHTGSPRLTTIGSATIRSYNRIEQMVVTSSPQSYSHCSVCMVRSSKFGWLANLSRFSTTEWTTGSRGRVHLITHRKKKVMKVSSGGTTGVYVCVAMDRMAKKAVMGKDKWVRGVEAGASTAGQKCEVLT